MRAGDVIANRFVLDERAGVGGMGVVFRAHDVKQDRVVAIKFLNNDHGDNTGRFLHESSILGALDHPHIVRHIAQGVLSSGNPWLAMEWLEGEDLAVRLSRGGLSVDDGLLLIRLVADALGAAHARGVVHRDVKPSNIFLVGGDIARVKLLDFGIARRVGTSIAATRLTATNAILGTPGYMAPEQAHGLRDIGPPADVFSLGCVFFECVTGQPVFQGAHLMALLAKLLLEEPRRLVDVLPEIPLPVSNLCQCMLAKNPASRPEDGHAIVREILALATVGSVSAASIRLDKPLLISAAERRLMSVVVVVPSQQPVNPLDDTAAPSADASGSTLRDVIAPFGAAVEVLADGTVLVVLAGAGNSVDLAIKAARCALSVYSLFPTARVVLTTGRGEMADAFPVGDVVDRAASLFARSTSALSRSGILIDDVTRALLDARFEIIEDSGDFRLLRENFSGDDVRTLLGKPSVFVGRERDLRNLAELLEEGFDERSSRAILVTAPAGMGKSRLKQELLRQLRDRHTDLALIIGRGDSLGVGASFGLLGFGIRSALGVQVGEPLDIARAKLTAAIGMFVPPQDVDRICEFVGELASVPFPDENSPRLRTARLNAPIMADQVETAFVEFARAVARTRPALVVLEDLHWADVASVKLLDVALRELRNEPFVVLAFARPEVSDVFPKLWAGRRFSEVSLNPLHRRASERLVRSALGDDVDATIVTAILDRSAGNPFFLEETIRAVAEGRGDTFPDTMLGMVTARLDALTGEERRLLRAASVFGEAFWTNGVCTLLGDESSLVDDMLVNLIKQEFLSKRTTCRFVGEEEYGFRHALVRQGAYAMLTERDRVLAHKLAGEWLERVGEPDATVLAEHFTQGAEPNRAVRWYAKSAEDAMGANDVELALVAVDRGLAVCTDEPAAAQLWGLRALAAWQKGNYSLAIDASEETMRRALSGSLDDCRAITAGCAGCLYTARIDLLPAYIGRLMSTEPRQDTQDLLATGLLSIVSAMIHGGQRDAAFPLLQRLKAISAAKEQEAPGVVAATNVAELNWYQHVERDLWQAYVCGRSAAQLSENIGDRYSQVSALSVTGWYLAMMGAFEEAEKVFDEVLLRAPKGTHYISLCLFYRAYMRVEQGRLAEAVQDVEAVLEWERSQGRSVIASAARNVLAEALLGLGDLDGSEAAFIAAGAGTSGLFSVDGCARGIRARRLLAQGDVQGAIHEADALVTLCRKGGVYETRFAYTLLARAEAHRAAGNIEIARIAIREARTELLKNANKIDALAYRQTFLAQIPGHVRTLEVANEWLGDEISLS